MPWSLLMQWINKPDCFRRIISGPRRIIVAGCRITIEQTSLVA